MEPNTEIISFPDYSLQEWCLIGKLPFVDSNSLIVYLVDEDRPIKMNNEFIRMMEYESEFDIMQNMNLSNMFPEIISKLYCENMPEYVENNRHPGIIMDKHGNYIYTDLNYSTFILEPFGKIFVGSMKRVEKTIDLFMEYISRCVTVESMECLKLFLKSLKAENLIDQSEYEDICSRLDGVQ